MVMKKGCFILLFVFIFFGCTAPLKARPTITGGIHAGPTFSKYIGKDFYRTFQYTSSWLVGSFLRIKISDSIFLIPEISYCRRGSTDDYKLGLDHYRTEIRLHYLDFICLAGVPISDKICLLCGPFWSRYLDGHQYEEVNNKKYDFQINEYYLPKYDYGITFGTQIALSRHFDLGIRYSYGLKKLYKSYANYYGVDPELGISNENLDIRNNFIAVTFGFVL